MLLSVPLTLMQIHIAATTRSAPRTLTATSDDCVCLTIADLDATAAAITKHLAVSEFGSREKLGADSVAGTAAKRGVGRVALTAMRWLAPAAARSAEKLRSPPATSNNGEARAVAAATAALSMLAGQVVNYSGDIARAVRMMRNDLSSAFTSCPAVLLGGQRVVGWVTQGVLEHVGREVAQGEYAAQFEETGQFLGRDRSRRCALRAPLRADTGPLRCAVLPRKRPGTLSAPLLCGIPRGDKQAHCWLTVAAHLLATIADHPAMERRERSEFGACHEVIDALLGERSNSATAVASQQLQRRFASLLRRLTQEGSPMASEEGRHNDLDEALRFLVDGAGEHPGGGRHLQRVLTTTFEVQRKCAISEHDNLGGGGQPRACIGTARIDEARVLLCLLQQQSGSTTLEAVLQVRIGRVRLTCRREARFFFFLFFFFLSISFFVFVFSSSFCSFPLLSPQSLFSSC